MRNLVGRFACAAFMVSCGAASLDAQQGPIAPVDMTLAPYASTAGSVKLPDGRELHLVCMGQGSPTVILSAGLGDWSGSAWSHIQPDIAKTTKACAWDRPGFGLSDGTATKATVATNTADLEEALSKGGVSGPYILVAHSLGAFETLLFADRNPGKVAGMVLVDPSTPDMIERGKRRVVELEITEPPNPRAPPGVLWRKCAEDVRNGTLKAGGPDPDRCLAFPAYFPRPVSTALKAKYLASAVQFSTAAAFYDAAPAEGSKTVINPARNYGDMPLVVLTSTVPPPGASPELAATVQALHVHDNDELAVLSRQGKNIGVPGASHYIQRDRPQAVIDAVNSVVQDARMATRR